MTAAQKTKHRAKILNQNIKEAREYCRINRIRNRILTREEGESVGTDNSIDERINLVLTKDKVTKVSWG